jgi:phage shock protein A
MTSSGGHAIVALVDRDALERARDRLAEAAENKPQPGDVDAALDRARAQVEALAAAAAELEASLPERVGEAVREGIRLEARPVSRQLAEVRGLANQTIRRLERIETELVAERNSRVDDLGLLVDLIESGWRAVDDRMRRIEEAVHDRQGAPVYRIGEAS